MRPRTSKPLHPTEDGKPLFNRRKKRARQIRKGKGSVYVDEKTGDLSKTPLYKKHKPSTHLMVDDIKELLKGETLPDEGSRISVVIDRIRVQLDEGLIRWGLIDGFGQQAIDAQRFIKS